MKSIMQHNFANVPAISKPRSSFQRNSRNLLSFDEDYLIPMFVDEILPGDTFNLKTSGFIRMSTPLYPIMDNIYADSFYFFIPLRLLWTSFVKMMGEQASPGDSTDYTVPTFSTGTTSEGDLSDYLGIPPGVDVSTDNISMLFHKAYVLCWNTWFRDQNLQNPASLSTGGTNETLATYNNLLKRGKRHDYFTSCLPWPAKYFEGTEVTLPLGTSAPISGLGVYDANSASAPGGGTINDAADGTGQNYTFSYENSSDTLHLRASASGAAAALDVYADLSNATAATVNQLRLSIQVQKLYEADGRSGTRYIEKVYAEFGVTSSDARFQRPEFLGGGTSRVNITPIPYNAEGASAAVGTLAAMGTCSFHGHGFTKSFEEHGIVLGLISVRADITYQQGIHRMFTRQDRLDFYTPALAHLGEQAVLNKEIYYQGISADDNVFGYQEHWGEYRYRQSSVHGAFRSAAASSLDAWHLSQDFSSLPTLGSTFIQSNTPMDRVVAVSSEPTFIGDFYHTLRCARVMPLYSVPGMMDHF